jgi:hypothetical protein
VGEAIGRSKVEMLVKNSFRARKSGSLMCLKIDEFVETPTSKGVGLARHTGILDEPATTLENLRRGNEWRQRRLIKQQQRRSTR